MTEHLRVTFVAPPSLPFPGQRKSLKRGRSGRKAWDEVSLGPGKKRTDFDYYIVLIYW
jgi:hypothetical protein